MKKNREIYLNEEEEEKKNRNEMNLIGIVLPSIIQSWRQRRKRWRQITSAH